MKNISLHDWQVRCPDLEGAKSPNGAYLLRSHCCLAMVWHCSPKAWRHLSHQCVCMNVSLFTGWTGYSTKLFPFPERLMEMLPLHHYVALTFFRACLLMQYIPVEPLSLFFPVQEWETTMILLGVFSEVIIGRRWCFQNAMARSCKEKIMFIKISVYRL